MKALFVLLLLAVGCVEKQDSEDPAKRTLLCNVSASRDAIQIKNIDAYGWDAVAVTLDGKFSASSKTPVLRRGVVLIQMRDCVDEDGNRFNPDAKRPRSVRIDVPGYNSKSYDWR